MRQVVLPIKDDNNIFLLSSKSIFVKCYLQEITLRGNRKPKRLIAVLVPINQKEVQPRTHSLCLETFIGRTTSPFFEDS